MRLSFSSLRKWFILGLLVSNLILGGLSFFLLRALDARYSELLGRSVPIMAELHGVTMSVMRSRRAMSDSLTAKPGPEQTAFLDRAVHFEQASAKARLGYQYSPDVLNGEAVDREMESVAADYKAVMQRFLGFVRNGRIAEASALRTNDLRVITDRYYELLEKRTTQIEERAEQMGQDYTKGISFQSKLVLTMASWPIMAALLVVLVFLITLLSLFVAVFTPRFNSQS